MPTVVQFPKMGSMGGGEALGWGKKMVSSILDVLHLNQKLRVFYFRSTYICVCM